jgi:hypothetical protein
MEEEEKEKKKLVWIMKEKKQKQCITKSYNSSANDIASFPVMT